MLFICNPGQVVHGRGIATHKIGDRGLDQGTKNADKAVLARGIGRDVKAGIVTQGRVALSREIADEDLGLRRGGEVGPAQGIEDKGVALHLVIGRNDEIGQQTTVQLLHAHNLFFTTVCRTAFTICDYSTIITSIKLF